MKNAMTHTLLVVVVALFAVACGGGEKRENRLPTVEQMNLYEDSRSATDPQPSEANRELAEAQEADYDPMTRIEQAGYYADQGAEATWEGGKWAGKNFVIGVEILLVLLFPYLVILLVPGFIAGKAEKVIEGVVIGSVGVFLAITAGTYLTSFAVWVAIWGLVLPGLILAVWGLITDSEARKLAIMLSFTGSLVIYLGWLAWDLFAWGMVTWGLLGFAVLAGLAWMIVRIVQAFAPEST